MGLRRPARASIISISWPLAGPEAPGKGEHHQHLLGLRRPARASIISISWPLAGPEAPGKGEHHQHQLAPGWA